MKLCPRRPIKVPKDFGMRLSPIVTDKIMAYGYTKGSHIKIPFLSVKAVEQIAQHQMGMRKYVTEDVRKELLEFKEALYS